MWLYIVVGICGFLTLAGASAAMDLGKNPAKQNSWSHVLLVASLWATTVGPGSQLFNLSEVTGSLFQKVLSIVFGILFLFVVVHTLTTIVDGARKTASLIIGVILGVASVILFGMAFGVPGVS